MSAQRLKLPEYLRRRCKLCGDYYTSGGYFVETGHCICCAKSTGWFTTTRTK